MEFLSKVTKDLEKAGIQVGSSEPPTYWFSMGNHVLNRIISGDFNKGVPQGRITALVGPSGTGKSFLVGNAVREAQKEGAVVVVLDSENALDDVFMQALGVDTEKDYYYVSVDTIAQTSKTVSTILKGYKKDFPDRATAPKLLIVIDSLSMLLTETEQDHFEKGDFKGDQGQKSKQTKQMLREFVQAIKRFNINMIVTDGVYKNQDLRNGEGVYIVSDAIKFSLSQIVMLTKLKMRDKVTRIVHGIFMKVEGYKTRFTKPFQIASLEVPYDTGMNPNSGLLDVMVELGLVEKRGSRFAITGEDKSFYSKDFDRYAEQLLAEADKMSDVFLDANLDDVDEVHEKQTSSKSKRQGKVTSTKNITIE